MTAGYKANEGNAGRLNRNEQVRARVEEILAVGAEKAGVSVQRIAEAVATPKQPKSTPRRGADPVIGVQSPRIARDRAWYAARLRSHWADRVMIQLEQLEVDYYLPRHSEVVIRRNRRVVHRSPLLLRTIFIGVRDADHLAKAQASQGIAEIVSCPEPDEDEGGNVATKRSKPARIKVDDLQVFVDAVAKGEVVEPTGVGIGQSVLVMDGPFASFPGVVEEMLPCDRVKVAVCIFGRPSPVELDLASVQVL